MSYVYYREALRRHYEHLEREHAKLSEEEAARTAVEKQNALYMADLMYLAGTMPNAEH